MAFIWFWGLVASAIIAGVFLIITLARIEAGAGGKGKWLVLTFCSLAVVSGLILLKPRQNAEQVQYMPPPSSVAGQVVEPKSEAQQKSSSSTSSVGGPAGEEKSNKTVDKNKEAQGIQGSAGDAQVKTQGEFNTVGDSDPLLEEILFLKRQAVEKKKMVVPEGLVEGTAAETADGASPGQSSQELIGPGYSEPEEQQFPEEKTGQAIAGNESKDEQVSQKVVSAKVSATSLNVRDRSDLSGLVIGILKSGDVIKVFVGSEAGEWCKVELNSGQTGWVMKKYIVIQPNQNPVW